MLIFGHFFIFFNFDYKVTTFFASIYMNGNQKAGESYCMHDKTDPDLFF